ncbi:Putative type I restriction enzyme HindVIIP specificity protein [Nitrosarchaeum koreense MY1]|uniref:Putative type I restriction enzyme HindVIIP specificity protein n=1 Tax=Nitrosarchaeum koreense MY1 TaxID=1001994 RepID=F9CXT3_9ARCH|nr:Putative type I restriction enzyme HindVIIP specificity protein [Nitrosarchaeum koreense MY1]
MGDVCNILTGKLNSNAAENFGMYPFFTCSKDNFKINSYSFDCEAILLAGNNAVGDFGIKHYKGKFDVYQRTYVITIKNESEFDYDFLYHTLKTHLKDFQRYSYGTATQYLTKSILDPFEFKAPNIQIQQKIGHILGTLNKSIEKLHLQNILLEKMIHSIFKSWFVDFDGQTEFVDSELGQIPRGWILSKLDDILSLLRDGSHNPPQRVVKGISFITGGTLNFIIEYDKATYITDEDYYKIQKNYQLKENDIMLSIVGTLGNVAIVRTTDLPLSHQRSAAMLRVNEKANFVFLYCLIKSPGFQLFLDTHQTRTAQPSIFLGTLSSYEFVLPSTKILNNFFRLGSPIIKKMQDNCSSILILEKIRDSLLPKLMSGEIRV